MHVQHRAPFRIAALGVPDIRAVGQPRFQRITRDEPGFAFRVVAISVRMGAMDTSDVAGDRLSVRLSLEAGVSVVSVSGEVDVFTSEVLREHLLRVITDEAFGGLVVDLNGVRFIDSTGIGVLVGVWHRVQATDRRMALARPSRPVRTVLHTAHLEKILAAQDSLAAAVAAVAS
jgi:anti-sigma B factor antagonist